MYKRQIINYENASCEDVKGLIALIQETVLRETGAVSYTHLDVYKRQTLGGGWNKYRHPFYPAYPASLGGQARDL